MNPFFSLLSAIYIFLIFWGADSPMLSQIGEFNPFSLLHIPLYGVLTLLLILALCPGGKRTFFRLAAVALIALAVAILDEFHQSSIPTREGSISDVLLDAFGIFLVMKVWPRVLSLFPRLCREAPRVNRPPSKDAGN